MENQNDSINSYISNAINENKNPQKTNFCNILKAAQVCETGKYDSALFLILKIDVSLVSKNEISQVWFNAVYGLILFRNNNYAEAYSTLSNLISNKSDQIDERGIGFCKRILARICLNMGDYSSFLLYIVQSSRHFENTGLKKSFFINQKLIGRYFILIGDFSEASVYFNKAIVGLKKCNDLQEVFYMYVNYTDLFLKKNDIIRAKLYADSCLLLSKKFAKNDMYALTFINLGEIEMKRANYRQAISHIQKALQFYLCCSDIRGEVISNINLSNSYLQLNMIDSSFVFAQKALFVAKKSNRKELLRSAYSTIAVVYHRTNNSDSAFKALELTSKYKDSIFSSETAASKAFFVVKTGLDQKEKELLLKETELSQQKTKRIIIFFVFGIIIILSGLFFVYYYFKNKSKVLKAHINGQEDIRKQIGKELHDSVGGDLFSLKTYFYNKSKNDLSFQPIVEQLNKTWLEVRNISHELDIPDFSIVSFEEVVQNLTLKRAKMHAIEMEYFQTVNNDIFSKNQELASDIYRIIQESITNIIKHSNATKAYIQLNCFESTLSIIIDDNGKGFNKKHKSDGIGLTNIRKRVESHKGTFDVDTSMNRGTILNISIPLVYRLK